jgi:glc operon protein GlcG
MTTESAVLRPTISDKWALKVLSVATAEAKRTGVNVTIAVVDESGVTKLTSRMDGAPLVSIETAANKAYAAAAIGIPPDDFYSAIESDGAAVASFGTRPGLALIAGGMPIIVSGQVAGAIGVAGAMTGAEDRRIAEVAVASLDS